MRTSGGRGAEGWIVAIPLLALVVAASMSAGGPEAMLRMLDDTIRTTMGSVVDLVRGLF
jgi:hypothetical protein